MGWWWKKEKKGLHRRYRYIDIKIGGTWLQSQLQKRQRLEGLNFKVSERVSETLSQ
jgi:hypothetical protein